jgi:DegV family protein with EDD domain
MSDHKRKVAIVTDTAAALAHEQIIEHRLSVARMEITIDGNTLVDGASAELQEFYGLLETAESIPTTSAPKPQEYLEKIQTAAEMADSVLCISVSARLSAAYDAANIGVELFLKQNPGRDVRVFDCGAAASSQALVVLAAARAAEAGGSIDDAAAAAVNVAGNVRLVAMLDTLRFIHKSGRVPKIAVWATSALNIKPVMEYSTGKIGAIARPRSVKKAVERIRREMSIDLTGKKAHINVIHAGAPGRAELLRDWAADNLDCGELFVTQFHPFMGAHTGPGLVGASWWSE